MAKEIMKYNGTIQSYTKGDLLGNGGNADVFEVTGDCGSIFAMKLLKSCASSNKTDRFFHEIKILEECKGMNGIIPILDKGDNFYIMPKGINAKDYLNSSTSKNYTEDVVSHIKSITNTLIELQKKSIVHRDIKVENIIFIEDKPYLADFGLAKKEGISNNTKGKDRIGALFTMAPEVKRNDGSYINYYLSDIYSLSKTLWSMLTKNYTNFDGQLHYASGYSLSNYKIKFYAILDELVNICTNDKPENRINYTDFIDYLERWLSNKDDMTYIAKFNWEQVKKILFGKFDASSCSWKSLDDIYNVLNLITQYDFANHTFLPSSGGLDLIGVEYAREDNKLLELNFDGLRVVCNPVNLSFYSHQNSNSNFILEVGELVPVLPSNIDCDYEVLTLLEDGVYTDYYCSEYGEFRGEKITNYKIIERRLKPGKYAIFLHSSDYNHGRFIDRKTGKRVDAYSGLHNKEPIGRFQDFIGDKVIPKKFKKPKYLDNSTTSKKKVLDKKQVDLVNGLIERLDELIEKYPSLSIDYKPINLFDEDVIEDIFKESEEKRELKVVFAKYSADDLFLIKGLYCAGNFDKDECYCKPLFFWLDFVKQSNNDIDLCGCIIQDLKSYIQKGLDFYS